jgi:hypothetical protein
MIIDAIVPARWKALRSLVRIVSRSAFQRASSASRSIASRVA